MAFRPLAHGADTSRIPDVSETEIVKSLIAKYGKTGPQIMLNWALQRGHIVIPKSNSLERIE